MASGTTDIGFGTLISFASFSGELTEVGGPSLSRDTVDTTHMLSPDEWREFIAGLKDGGEVTLTVHFDPAEIPPIESAKGTVTITWPDGTPWSFDGIVTAYEPAAPVDDKMVASITIKVSGKVNFS